MDLNLVPINQIAKATQVDKIHLAYLTKLRLIPQTIRRKIDGKIMGCYPAEIISKIRQIEEFKSRGLTYSQIKFELDKTIENRLSKIGLENRFSTFETRPSVLYQPSSSAFVFLVIGLILGYVLFSLNNINSSQAAKNTQATVAAATLPESNSIVMTSQNENQPIYLIAVPDKNLYKLGTVNLKL